MARLIRCQKCHHGDVPRDHLWFLFLKFSFLIVEPALITIFHGQTHLFLLQPSPSPVVVFVAGAVAAREFAQRHQWTTPRLPGRCDAIAGWNGMDAMGWVGWDGMG